MFLCLSSGSSPRYREDVLRALSMPWGSVLQFRYDKKWIAPGALSSQEITEGRKPAALIAYIDQSDPAKTPEIVPCRFASIVEATEHGTTASLQLELSEFAYAEDLTKFNVELQAASAGALPAWQVDKKLKGHYWLEVSVESKNCVRSVNLTAWERIVCQLGTREEFKAEGCFYTVVGITDVSSREAVSINDHRYEFAPGHEYELQMYHYSPKSVPVRTGLTITSTSPWLSFTTNPVLSMDSRYDLKRIRFLTLKPPNRSQAVISVTRNPEDDGLPYLDFDLPVLVRGIFWRTLIYGIVFGTLLAGPQIVAALSNPSLPASNIVSVCFASALLGLAAGITAAFGLRTSL
jgi:hypothetical protein